MGLAYSHPMFKLGLIQLAVLFALGAQATAAARFEFKLLNGLNYYQFLGVSAGASEGEIKRAYRVAMKKHHPDRGGDQATAQFVNEAYEILGDGYRRKAFDQWLKSGSTDQVHDAERRSEILNIIVEEVSDLARAELAKNPHMTKVQMAALARGIIIYHSRFLPGSQIAVTDLETLLNQFALAHSVGRARGYAEMLSLAIGAIEILRERARYPGLEDGRQAKAVLQNLESRLASVVVSHLDPSKRIHFDRVYEFLTGQSILRANVNRSCEAALRYKSAEDLTTIRPLKIDILL